MNSARVGLVDHVPGMQRRRLDGVRKAGRDVHGGVLADHVVGVVELAPLLGGVALLLHHPLDILDVGVGRVELLHVVGGAHEVSRRPPGELAQEQAVGLGEAHREGVVVDDRQLHRLASPLCPGRQGGRDLLVEVVVLEGKSHVLGGDRHAVRPLQPLADGEGELVRRVVLLPALQDGRLDLGAHEVVAVVAGRRRDLHELHRVQVAQVVVVVDGVLGPGQGAAVLAVLHPGLHHHGVVGQPLFDRRQTLAGQERRLREGDLGAGALHVVVHVVLADRQPYAVRALAFRGGGRVAGGSRLFGAAGHHQQRRRAQRDRGQECVSFHGILLDVCSAVPWWWVAEPRQGRVRYGPCQESARRTRQAAGGRYGRSVPGKTIKQRAARCRMLWLNPADNQGARFRLINWRPASAGSPEPPRP